MWGLVSGGVEDDETLLEALRREVREETGLEIRSYALFGTFSDPTRIASYPDGNVYSIFSIAFTVQPSDLSPLRASAESVELRFFPRAELPLPDLVATHRQVLDRYLGGDAPPFLD